MVASPNVILHHIFSGAVSAPLEKDRARVLPTPTDCRRFRRRLPSFPRH